VRAAAQLLLAASALVALAAPPVAAEPVRVDWRANHPNGRGFVVRSVDVGEDTTRVDITATTAGEDVYLNWNGSMKLVDDQGAAYRVVPPLDNQQLQVPVNSRLTGEMIFAGRINPAAKRVLLTTIEGVGGAPTTGSPTARSPASRSRSRAECGRARRDRPRAAGGRGGARRHGRAGA
jgi:hypothetical protein